MKKIYTTIALCLGFLLVNAQESPDCFSLRTTSAFAQAGEEVCVEVTANDFSGILGLQFTLEWNPEQLDFQGVSNFNLPGLSENNFGSNPQLIADGILTFSWISINLLGYDLPDGAALFSLCFTVQSSAEPAATVRFVESPVPFEAVVAEGADNATLGHYLLFSGSVQPAGAATSPLTIASGCGSLETCSEGSGGSVDLTTNGGNAPYQFSWTGPDSFLVAEEDLTALRSGRYHLVISDATGAEVEALAVLEGNSPLISEVTLLPSTCAGAENGSIDIAVVEGTPPYNYSWSNGSTNEDLEGLAPGIYTLTVTDAAGCQAVRSFELAQADQLGIIESVKQPDCGQTNGYIDLQAPANALPYTYTWNTGANTEDLTGIGAGSYSVIVRDTANGCDAVLADIKVDQLGLHADIVYRCLPDGKVDIIARTSGNGTGPFTFQWSDGTTVTTQIDSSLITRPTPSGPYQVTITDSGECSAVASAAYGLDCNDPKTSELDLYLPSLSVQAGNPFCIDLKASDFQDMESLQLSLVWDATQMRFTGIENIQLPGFNEGNYALLSSGPDTATYLSMLWLDSQTNDRGFSLPPDSSLLTLCFEPLISEGEIRIRQAIYPTPFEAVTHDGKVYHDGIQEGVITVWGEHSVWPGDTDADQLVTHFDLLNIGLANGAEGPARPEASIDWRPQAAEDWPQETPASGINYKHIDTDGNGHIEPADTAGLAANYGRQAGENGLAPNAAPRDESGIPLYIEAHEAASGTSASFQVILGEANQPANDIYGLAFSITYDTTAVKKGTAAVRFSDSWIGAPGNDLLVFQRDSYEEGRIDVAITRLDGVSRSGNGAIGELLVTIEDVILIRSDEYELPFRIERVRMINYQEMLLPVFTPETKAVISGTTSLYNPQLSRQVTVYPVPAKEAVFIASEGLLIRHVECFDAHGQRIGTAQDHHAVDVRNWKPGLYLLRILTDQGPVVKKLLVQP